MSESELLDLWRHALETVIFVAGPFILAALCVGLVIAVFQAATQLQESVLSFAPKLVAIGLILSFGGSWLLHRLAQQAIANLSAIQDVARSQH